MTSATEVLCRLLDEQRLEWREHEAPATDCIAFFDGEGWHDCWESVGGEVNVTFSMTPAQAIAATLGATDAKPTQVESSETCHDKGTFKSWGLFTCSNCSNVFPLNAVKDAPSIGRTLPPNYCPNCGAKVVEPTTNDVDAEVDE